MLAEGYFLTIIFLYGTQFTLIPFFSQLNEIIFYKISDEYRKVVLNCIDADQIHTMKFVNCKDIDPITELLPCTSLEKLAIWNSGFLPFDDASASALRDSPEDQTNYSQFLPNLKNFATYNSCLGECSPLFECHRPSLTALILSCSHIGISSTPLNWEDIPDLWPNLESLHLDKTSGLSIKMVSQILPRLVHLQTLGLLQSMLSSAEDRCLAQMIGRLHKPLDVFYRNSCSAINGFSYNCPCNPQL